MTYQGVFETELSGMRGHGYQVSIICDGKHIAKAFFSFHETAEWYARVVKTARSINVTDGRIGYGYTGRTISIVRA